MTMQLVASGFASGTTISLSSIPQTGNTLLLVADFKSDRSGSTDSQNFVYFNNDSAGTYNVRYVRQFGTSSLDFSNGSGGAFDYSWNTPGTSATLPNNGYFSLKINNYANSSLTKVAMIQSYTQANSTSGLTMLSSIRYNSTSPITTVNLGCTGGVTISGRYWLYLIY